MRGVKQVEKLLQYEGLLLREIFGKMRRLGCWSVLDSWPWSRQGASLGFQRPRLSCGGGMTQVPMCLLHDSCAGDSMCTCQRNTWATVEPPVALLLPRPPPLLPTAVSLGQQPGCRRLSFNHPKHSILAGGRMGRTLMPGLPAAGTRLAAMGRVGNLRASWCPCTPRGR